MFYMAQRKMQKMQQARQEWEDSKSDNSRSDISQKSGRYSANARSISPVGPSANNYRNQLKPNYNEE